MSEQTGEKAALTSAEIEDLHGAMVEDGCHGFWTDHTYTPTAVERIVAARVVAAKAEAWDEGFDAGWSAQDPDDHAPNPYTFPTPEADR